MNALLLSLLLAAGAAAEPNAPEAPAKSKGASHHLEIEAKENPNKIRCVETNRSNSRVAKRDCRTLAQWAQARRLAEQDVEEMQGVKANTERSN
jgi:hypothetical protein